MTRRRWIYDEKGNAIEVTHARYASSSSPAGPDIMPDIKPYISMVTGEEITSRSRHREHLRDHNLIEVGNEVDHLVKNMRKPEPPPGLHETMMRAAYKHGILK